MSPLIRRWNASFGNCAWPWFPPWFQRLFRRCLGDFEGGRFTKTAQGWGWLVHVFVACFCCSKDEQKRLGFIFPLFHLILTWTRFLEHFLGDSGISSWTCIWHYWEGVRPKPWFFDGETNHVPRRTIQRKQTLEDQSHSVTWIQKRCKPWIPDT